MAVAFARGGPLHALALTGRKLLLIWNAHEVPQIESMESFARAAGPLGLPVAGSYGFLAILGLPGIVWAWRRGAAARWLVGDAAIVTLGIAPFFVTDRYRSHVTSALAVLAAIAIAELARARAPARSRVAAWLGVGAAAVVVLVPIATASKLGGEWTFAADQAMRLLDRGVLRPGMAADLVVFDPAKVIDLATYAEPSRYPEGFDVVIVNGKVVLDEGKLTAERPGRPLRR